jgi:dTDP-4-dehydrorhamnose reductase
MAIKNLLVTGASGFLGWNICKSAASSWRVYGTAYRNRVSIPGCTTVSLDLTNAEDVHTLFRNIVPDAVIHCAAFSQPNACQENPEDSYKTNVGSSITLAKLCADLQIPFLFTSTDLVFDGTNPPYSEDDPVSPISTYGEQKVKAEREILSRHPDAVVCRMPLMFGDTPAGAISFLQPMLSSLQNNNTLTLFTDEFRSPVSGFDAARGMLMALDTFHGIVHLGGRRPISRYDFGMALAQYCGFDTSRIKPLLQKDIAMSAPRPQDVSLDSSLAFSKGFSPLDVPEAFGNLECLKQFRNR